MNADDRAMTALPVSPLLDVSAVAGRPRAMSARGTGVMSTRPLPVEPADTPRAASTLPEVRTAPLGGSALDTGGSGS
jgi:hypothetical protein